MFGKAEQLKMEEQLSFDFAVTPEMSCIMCHLSSECHGCCRKCTTKCSNTAQNCSLPRAQYDLHRWRTWIALVRDTLPELKQFVPKKYHKSLKL